MVGSSSRGAVLAVCLVLGLVLSIESAHAELGSDAPKQPNIDLAVYGSGSFRSGMSVGTAPVKPSKNFQRVMVSGAKAEISFHDRSEVSCSASKRWVVYSGQKTLRTHRPGNKGGFVISTDQTRFLKDINIGGIIATKSLQLQGVGPRQADSEEGEPVLIGSKAQPHLKMGYNKGLSWIQSMKTHMAINPFRNSVAIGTTKMKKRLTISGGHLRVNNKFVVGGSNGKGSISSSHLRFANGGGWYMTDTSYLRTVGNLPIYTKGSGKFMGNVGIGTLPKFPIFRLQVHAGAGISAHGAVMVTDKADKGFTISQTKEGALLRSWNINTKKHEAMLVEAGPLLIQPRSGIVLFGTTVRKKRMHLHIRGNLYIHGHMFAMKNLHVRDHANLKHLLMPSLNLKNKPQSPDGDTLVLGHMKKKKKDKSEPGPWETGKKKKVITGINLRFGFKNDYTWIQVHGKRKGKHEPLALNPLGNTVSIGSVKPDRRVSMYANGNGYVLGTLFVKVGNAAKTSLQALKESREAEAAQEYNEADMTDEQALAAMRAAQVRYRTMAKTAEAQDELLNSRMMLINVPEHLRAKKGQMEDEVSINKLTQMVYRVLRRQESHMTAQEAILAKQADKIKALQDHIATMHARALPQ